MQSEDDRWDPATVVGLRSSEHVLVLGNPAFMPWLGQLFEQRPAGLMSTRKLSQAASMASNGERFDRVIVAREVEHSNEHILLAGMLHAQLVCFLADDGWQMEQSIEFYYPDARWWRLDSTFGAVIIAEPQGKSWKDIWS